MDVSLKQFVHEVTHSGLISAEELAAFQQRPPAQPRPDNAESLSQQLIEARKLTPYQAAAVAQRNAKSLMFAEYVILDKLGEGGMGVVLKARHRRMDRLVAIKMLPQATMNSPQAVERFYREVKAAARLSHPNIVAAYDAGEHLGTHYLVMEYVDGQDLAEVVKQHGPLPVPEAIECILQAASGLQYAHEQGIIHRDIKPGNLLLDTRGTVKILDMGLARMDQSAREEVQSERLTESGQIMGTGDYMAPEQALDTHRADARSDIYSLGCSLYRLLTGMPPYQGQTFTQLFLAHHEAAIPSLAAARPDVPPALDAVFHKMVAKQPHERQQTMREVIAELEAVQETGHGSAGHELSNGDALTFPPEHIGATATQEVVAHTEIRTCLRSRWTDTLRTRRGMWIGLGALATLALAAVIVAMRPPDRRKTSTSPENAPPPARAPFNAPQAREHQAAWAKHLGLPVETTNSIGMKLALIPPGEFPMGSTPEQIAQELDDGKKRNEPQWYLQRVPAEGPSHRVTIRRPFYLGLYEVTQSEYERVMGVNPSAYCAEPMASSSFDPPLGEQQNQHRVARAKHAARQDTSRHPVETVSWNDATEFCRRLSALPAEHAANRAYRLPTEAEWEYACRAGTTTRWWCGDNAAALKQCAWYGMDADDATYRVGQKQASPWSLYDMHGNVWEWCLDCYDTDYYERSPNIDPQASTGPNRSVRGGCTGSAGICRSAYRHYFEPDKRSYHQGFRVCLVLAQSPDPNLSRP